LFQESVASIGILAIYVESNLAFKENLHGINHFARAHEEFGFDPVNGECIHTRNNKQNAAP